jgi:putative membrane protein
MIRAVLCALVIAVLAAIWLGPLPALARHSFAAHMTMHMGVVAVAAPLIALSIAGSRHDPVRRVPWLGAPILASMLEFAVVWGWHAPAAHHAARHHAWAFVLEQGSFLVAGGLLWIAAIGGDRPQRLLRAGSGVVALLFTSMHVTLLGALFAMAPRPLVPHRSAGADALVLADQHLGGAIMLLAGGVSYLVGGVWLTARMLRPERMRPLAGRESFS